MTKFRYETDLLGNMQSILSGLQGYDVLALELIQNADDAEAENLEFDVDDDALRARNDRLFKTCGLEQQVCPWEAAGGRRCDFHAIMRIGGRNKVAQEEMIGRFGIGFISVFQITDAPRIRSGPHEIVLSPIDGDIARTAITPISGTQLELPWARTLSPTRKGLNASPVPPDAAEKMAEALSEVARRSLIFLRHLSRLTLRRNGLVLMVTTVRRQAALVVVESTGTAPARWLMLMGDAAAETKPLLARYETLARLGRRSEISLAIPLEAPSDFRGLLYAYLPTEQASGLPVHINGDFFPHPNRRAVVLTGESHERYFNEALLKAAARLIGEHLLVLRDQLNPTRLWAVLGAAFAEDQPPLYWEALGPLAMVAEIALVGAGWRKPDQTFLAGTALTAVDEADAAQLGVPLILADLRPYRNVLANLGALPFALSRLLPFLTAWLANTEPTTVAELAPAWRLIETLLGFQNTPPLSLDQRASLTALPLALDGQGAPATLKDVFRRPPGPAGDWLRQLDLGVAFATDEIEQYPQLADLLDPFTAEDLASFVASAIPTPEAALQRIGLNPRRQALFLDLFAGLCVRSEQPAKIRSTLWSCPILPAGERFVTPAEAVFPSDFVDPLNRFTSVDKTALGAAGESFVRDVLGVQALNFATYVDEHLEDAVAEGLTTDEYRRLLTELVRHHASLLAAGLGDRLASIPLARNCAGEQVEPESVYRRRPDLVALFGDDPALWLDENLILRTMPLGALEFFERLGMPREPVVEHLVERLEVLTENPPSAESLAGVAAVARHLLDRLDRLEEADRKALKRLAEREWLPASKAGELDRSSWYAAGGVYQPFRASGFDSQAFVVELPGLRQHTHGRAFLDLLGVTAEPPTTVVVDHLLQCMAAQEEPNDTTYAILNERANQPVERGPLEALRGRDFIFDRHRSRFVSARQVFWQKPPLGARWSQASARMTAMEALYRLLGVKDAPEPHDFADLVVTIAQERGENPVDVTTSLEIEYCLSAIAQALVDDGPNQAPVLDTLAATPCLLTVARTFAYPGEVAWIDAPWLAETFAGDLDHLLVPPFSDRALGQQLFNHLDVRPLSEAVRLQAQYAGEPIPDPEAVALLVSRIDLIVQLAPTAAIAAHLRDRLHLLTIGHTPTLTERGEFACDGEPIVSKARTTDAFYDLDQDCLILRGRPEDPVDWSQAFKALFLPLTIGARTDLRQLVLAAAYIISARTRDQAERNLIGLGYEPWAEAETLADGSQLADLQAEDCTPEEAVLDDADALQASFQGPSPNEEATDPSFHQATSTASAPRRSTAPAASSTTSSRVGTVSSLNGGSMQKGGGTTRTPSERERSARTARMLSYVAPRLSGQDATTRLTSIEAVGLDIDEAAMAAVLKYEAHLGRQASRKAHNHPGYDISSVEPDGVTRLIEVKGLQDAWTPRGVKLSSTQFATAEKNHDIYWLYVVEFALNVSKQKIHAIQNPFDKVQEYWFDNGWQEAAEYSVGGPDIHAVPGGKVRHEVWGAGEIIKAYKVDGVLQLIVEFGRGNGRKSLPINKLEIVA